MAVLLGRVLIPWEKVVAYTHTCVRLCLSVCLCVNISLQDISISFRSGVYLTLRGKEFMSLNEILQSTLAGARLPSIKTVIYI